MLGAIWWGVSLGLLILGFAFSLVATYEGTRSAITITDGPIEGTVHFHYPETSAERFRAGTLPGIALMTATLGGLAGLVASPPGT